MGLDTYSAGSFEEMAEQNEAAEAAKLATENVATEAKSEPSNDGTGVADKKVVCDCPDPDCPCNNEVEPPKTV